MRGGAAHRGGQGRENKADSEVRGGAEYNTNSDSRCLQQDCGWG